MRYHPYFVLAENDTILSFEEHKEFFDITQPNVFTLPNEHNFKDDNFNGLLKLLKDIL